MEGFSQPPGNDNPKGPTNAAGDDIPKGQKSLGNSQVSNNPKEFNAPGFSRDYRVVEGQVRGLSEIHQSVATVDSSISSIYNIKLRVTWVRIVTLMLQYLQNARFSANMPSDSLRNKEKVKVHFIESDDGQSVEAKKSLIEKGPINAGDVQSRTNDANTITTNNRNNARVVENHNSSNGHVSLPGMSYASCRDNPRGIKLQGTNAWGISQTPGIVFPRDLSNSSKELNHASGDDTPKGHKPQGYSQGSNNPREFNTLRFNRDNSAVEDKVLGLSKMHSVATHDSSISSMHNIKFRVVWVRAVTLMLQYLQTVCVSGSLQKNARVSVVCIGNNDGQSHAKKALVEKGPTNVGDVNSRQSDTDIKVNVIHKNLKNKNRLRGDSAFLNQEDNCQGSADSDYDDEEDYDNKPIADHLEVEDENS